MSCLDISTAAESLQDWLQAEDAKRVVQFRFTLCSWVCERCVLYGAHCTQGNFDRPGGQSFLWRIWGLYFFITTLVGFLTFWILYPNYLPSRKAPEVNRDVRRASWEHADSVRLDSYSALRTQTPMPVSAPGSAIIMCDLTSDLTPDREQKLGLLNRPILETDTSKQSF